MILTTHSKTENTITLIFFPLEHIVIPDQKVPVWMKHSSIFPTINSTREITCYQSCFS
jgi:hypothetical protein